MQQQQQRSTPSTTFCILGHSPPFWDGDDSSQISWLFFVLYCIFVFINFYGASHGMHEPFRSAPDHSNWHCIGVFTPKRYTQLQVKYLPRVPYVAARAGFEPATLRSKGIDSTNALPRPTDSCELALIQRRCEAWLSLWRGLPEPRNFNLLCIRPTCRLHSWFILKLLEGPLIRSEHV